MTAQRRKDRTAQFDPRNRRRKTKPSQKCERTGKDRFRDRNAAAEALKAIRFRRAHDNDDTKHQQGRYYECQYCNGFHVTHKSRAEYIAEVERRFRH